MATKIKPQRIEANNSPQVGYVPKYVDKQTFEWGAGSGSTDIGNNYLILTDTMAGTPPEVDIADTRITDTTPYIIFYETQPVGNITRTLTNGNLHIASDDNADTLDVNVVFMGIGPARNYMKGVFAFTGTTHQILDPRITASSAVVAMPRPTPVGYITGSTDVGEINFASTGVEIGVLVDYVVFNDGVAFSDGMAYNATLDDDDILFRKNSASGVDEAFKVSDFKTKVGGMGGYETPITTLNLSVVAPTGNVNSSTHSPVSNERANITFNVSIGSHGGGYSRSILFQESDDELVWNTIWSDVADNTGGESRTTTLNLDLFANKHYRTRVEYGGVVANGNASSVMITYIK